MTTYLVKYKRPGQLFFRRIRRVKGDWGINDHAIRCFETADGRRFEVPTDGTVFVFGRERLQVIAENMAKESGQKIAAS